MQIEIVPEYKISDNVHKIANRLLVESFPDYPLNRSYYKLLPQFRYLVWVSDNLVAQVGIEHQIIGIGEESMADCMMVKKLGDKKWQDGIVDLLGYLF
jgi:hypothetical protein